ncbi:uncharacterized protein [Bemisia tabaci]|uniref:uncharacterized protein isoform X1 n=1 Tax=Bemisia tabaci TaxID=7038 RepID=UPI003B289405
MSGNPRRRFSQEPISRKGRYKKRKRDDTPFDLALALQSSDSSNSGDAEIFQPLHESTPIKSEGRSVYSDIESESLTSNQGYQVGEPSNMIQSDTDGETSNMIQSDTVGETSNSNQCPGEPLRNQSSIFESTVNSLLNISFFEEEENGGNLEERCMALDESFQSYTVIDPLPDDQGIFHSLQSDNFNPFNFDDPAQNHFYSSDEEDSSDDIDLTELLQYCQNKAEEEGEMDEHLSGMKKFLREWSMENSISLLSLSRLLKGLKKHHPSCFSKLPVDGRTIMGTCVEKLDIIPVPPGQYVHLGFKKQLDFIASFISEEVTSLGALVNIDGVRIYKHSKFSMYPILVTFPTCLELKNKVFPVGLYYGKGKPEDMSLFLTKFIEEITSLMDIHYENEEDRSKKVNFYIKGRIVKIILLGFDCDTPARSEILETVGHGGFYSCFRCTTRGESISTKGTIVRRKRRPATGVKRAKGSKRIFPELNAPLRDDFNFRNKLYARHQPRKLSPLVQLPGLHFPRSFVLEPMHLIFLGVTKAILSLLFLGGPYLLKPSLRQRVQNKLNDCVPYIPTDFPRKPTEIRSVGTSKATEARFYLLYLGPVILKNAMDRERYIHFLKLTVAMRIYHHAGFCANNEARTLAKVLVQEFVRSVPELYGKINMSHNMHSLYHFPDDIEWFRESIPEFTANDISSFPPENFNQVFRRYTRGYAKALQQNVRRLGELFQSDFWREKYKKDSNSSSKEIQFKLNHQDGPCLPTLKGRQFKQAIFPRFTLTLQQADCTCGTKAGDVIIVRNFVEDKDSGEKFIVGQKYGLKGEFFGDPLISSKKLGIFKVTKLSSIFERWPATSITTKFVRLPYVKNETIPIVHRQEEFIVLPLLHSEVGPSTS